MSKLMIKNSIAILINDHAPMHDGDDGPIECLCGDTFPYHSRWSLHVAETIVDKILGGAL